MCLEGTFPRYICGESVALSGLSLSHISSLSHTPSLSCTLSLIHPLSLASLANAHTPTHTCTYPHTHAHTHARMHTPTDICTHPQTHAHTHTCSKQIVHPAATWPKLQCVLCRILRGAITYKIVLAFSFELGEMGFSPAQHGFEHKFFCANGIITHIYRYTCTDMHEHTNACTCLHLWGGYD